MENPSNISNEYFGHQGLSEAEVKVLRDQHGTNALTINEENGFTASLKEFLTEPIAILLFAAAAIYFISNEIGDGLFMVGAILLVGTISLYQDTRSRNALKALQKMSASSASVLRNGVLVNLPVEEIVLGDTIIVQEGKNVPADADILQSHDFTVDESIFTGESFPQAKSATTADRMILRGTSVTGGFALAKVVGIGANTRLGQLGDSIASLKEEKTPLQTQINSFIRMMAIWGTLVFLLVWGLNFIRSQEVLDSLLKALTIAMSILPEEIPVAFTTFMALGSWRLMNMGVIVKKIKTVETLGSATVICADKTGTITENRMTLDRMYTWPAGKIVTSGTRDERGLKDLITYAMWASEPIPFDPMEKAIHRLYGEIVASDARPGYRMVHEYPLGGKPPMMTHIFQGGNGDTIIAVKGAPEAVLRHSELKDEERSVIQEQLNSLMASGYRVLGVGRAHYSGGAYLKQQDEYTFEFLGLLAFYDPPKENISGVLDSLYRAGIEVNIITGDSEATTRKIAREIGFRGYEDAIGGEDIVQMDAEALQNIVSEKKIFSRMFPQAKLRVVEALKKNGQIVAMTGDGVNDGPALKAAHIGIAMGSKGTEVAKEASSLVLRDNDLSAMVDAIAMGRKIYSNLKKAIQYIISIHIPIILSVFIPLALNWKYPNIFTPVHIIFLELIMGPTCSIIYENEPMERNAMDRKPRLFTTTFFNRRELVTSFIQGLVITAACLITYQWAIRHGLSGDATRTMVFLCLVSANIWLTLVNRSFYYSILTSFRYRNQLIPIIIGVTLLLTMFLLLFPPARTLFQFAVLSPLQLGLAFIAGFVSVIWFELYKLFRRLNLIQHVS